MNALEPIAQTQTMARPWPRSRGRDEKRLLAALTGAAGERRAAEELVEATWRQIYAALFRITGGDPELAADLTQEAYRKAWAALPGFDGRARFSTWLYRIAYTTFLNHARRPRRVVPLGSPASADGEDPPPAEESVADPSPPADEALAAQGAHDRLRRAVLALPEELRYTVTARFWGDLPVSEIATQEGVTGVAIRKRLKKAMALLAVGLEEPS